MMAVKNSYNEDQAEEHECKVHISSTLYTVTSKIPVDSAWEKLIKKSRKGAFYTGSDKKDKC